MSKIKHTPDGVSDWLPKECEIKNIIIDKVENTFLGFGYKQLESPLFEFAEVFDVSLTNKSQNKLYRFSDDKGNMLALRADMTPPIVRIACTAYKNEPCVFRFFYSGNVFINNKNFQGKLRENYQAGIELMGIDSPEADAEAVEITIKGLEAAGVKGFVVNLSHADFFKGILAECDFDSQTNTQILDMLDNMDYAGIAGVVKDSEADNDLKYILENISLLVGNSDMLEHYRKRVKNNLSISALNRLKEVYAILKDAGLSQYVSFDLGIANHLHYYTGIMFSAYAFGTGFPVASGGRYDNLAEKFGVKMPSVGVAIKINNVLEIIQIDESQKKVKFLISYDKHSEAGCREAAYKTAHMLRRKGYIVENSFCEGSPGKMDAYKALHFPNASSVSVLDTETSLEHTISIGDFYKEFSLLE